jgi:small GTP-binding protein
LELNAEPLRIVKVFVAGEGGVGKTTMIKRYTTGTFIANTMLTVGVEFHISKVPEARVTLQIWDLGGEDRFRFILPAYIRGASGGLLVFDMTRYQTFKNLSDWMDIIQKNAPNTPLILVGAKADLAEQAAVQEDTIDEFRDRYNFSEYFKASAKTGENVGEIFMKLAEIIAERLDQFEQR